MSSMMTPLTTLIGGSVLSVGMFKHLNTFLPATVKGLPKSIPIIGSIALTYLGFHIAGMTVEMLLPLKTNESTLKQIIRPLAHVFIGSAYVIVQLAFLNISGILSTKKEITPLMMLKIQLISLQISKIYEDFHSGTPFYSSLQNAMRQTRLLERIQA